MAYPDTGSHVAVGVGMDVSDVSGGRILRADAVGSVVPDMLSSAKAGGWKADEVPMEFIASIIASVILGIVILGGCVLLLKVIFGILTD